MTANTRPCTMHHRYMQKRNKQGSVNREYIMVRVSELNMQALISTEVTEKGLQREENLVKIRSSNK